MMNFYEIHKAYKETKLYNFLLECLASENKKVVELAKKEIEKKNFQNADDVKMFVALNI